MNPGVQKTLADKRPGGGAGPGFRGANGYSMGAGGDGLEFWGGTFVAAPNGTIIAEAPTDKETVLVVDLDRSFMDTQRTHWPFLRDRRIDAYAGIEKRFID